MPGVYRGQRSQRGQGFLKDIVRKAKEEAARRDRTKLIRPILLKPKMKAKRKVKAVFDKGFLHTLEAVKRKVTRPVMKAKRRVKAAIPVALEAVRNNITRPQMKQKAGYVGLAKAALQVLGPELVSMYQGNHILQQGTNNSAMARVAKSRYGFRK